MSQIEDPAQTLSRLLKTNLHVTKEDGALANVDVGGEWQNAQAFRGLDGQVTVGLAETVDQKLELTGKARRRQSTLRVGVWTTEQAGLGESAKALRGKIVEEVTRVIHQNRSRPNQTQYDFYNLGAASQTHHAYSGNSETPPNSAVWTELSAQDYAKLWFSDEDRCQVVSGGDGEVAAFLFGFKIESSKEPATKLVLAFEGSGTAPLGNGFSVKAWNSETAAWGSTQQSAASGNEQTVTITLTQDLPDFIDDAGYVWLLAQTTQPSDGETPAALNCDYVNCTVTVNGITYCDLVSYRVVDRVDVKPFVFHTEFTVKSWFFEQLGE